MTDDDPFMSFTETSIPPPPPYYIEKRLQKLQREITTVKQTKYKITKRTQ